MSQHTIDTTDDRLDVCLGYDEGLSGFWLFIQDHSRTNHGDPFYLFHNVDDVPNVRMKLSEVETQLARFNIPLPRDLANTLIDEAEEAGYTDYLKETEAQSELEDFEKFKKRIRYGKRSLLAAILRKRKPRH
jgi:hypothetical protein